MRGGQRRRSFGLRLLTLLRLDSASHLVKLHEQGGTREQIIDTLQGLPVVRPVALLSSRSTGVLTLLLTLAHSTLP